MKPHLLVVALGFVALGCEAHPQPSPTTGPASEATATASGSPAGSGSAKPAARPGDQTAAFHVVAWGREPTRIVRLGTSSWLTSQHVFYRLDGSGLIQDRALHRGFPGALPSFLTVDDGFDIDFEGFEIKGAWPHAAWLQAYGYYWTCSFGPGCEVKALVSYRWEQDGWKRARINKGDEAILAVSAPSSDRAIAVVGNRRGLRLVAAGADTTVGGRLSTPSEAPPRDPDGNPVKLPESGCTSALAISPYDSYYYGTGGQPLLVLPTGHVLLAGWSCADAGARWLVERFEPGQDKGVVDTLERPAGDPEAAFVLAGNKPDEIYLAALDRRWLLRFDGATWAKESLPAPGRVTDLAMAPDATLWLALRNGLFRRPPGGAWSQVALPRIGLAEPTPLSLSVTKDGGSWLVASAGATIAVMHSKPSSKPFELPSTPDVLWNLPNYPAVATEACQEPYVVLVDQFKPDTAALPEIARRLAQVPGSDKLEFGTEVGRDRVTMGTAVPNLAMGRQVLEAMEGQPGVVPTLLCHQPRYDKTITLEAAK